MDTKGAVDWLNANKYLSRYKEVIELLERGEKFENMWNRLREDYGGHYYKHPIDEHVTQMSPIYEILDRLFTEFFGSRPETRKEKINAIMTKMRDLGVAKNDIITLLIELRDGTLEENA